MNLSYKYAEAFLNVYNDRLKFEDIEHINKAIQFLQEHPRALFLLQVPVIKQQLREKGLASLCKRFEFIAPIQELVMLLLNHKRIYLLPSVLKAIVDCYQKRHTIEKIVIKSSIPLPQKYRQTVEQFIDRHIAGTKQYRYEIDPTLIAGIRIQSDTVLWEYSMNKRLRDIAHATRW